VNVHGLAGFATGIEKSPRYCRPRSSELAVATSSLCLACLNPVQLTTITHDCYVRKIHVSWLYYQPVEPSTSRAINKKDRSYLQNVAPHGCSGQHAVRAEISCKPVHHRPQMALNNYCKMLWHSNYNASGSADSACQCRPSASRLRSKSTMALKAIDP
jgi:hypothetical protein